MFYEATTSDFAGFNHDLIELTESGQGCDEERVSRVIEIPEDHTQRDQWEGLRTLVSSRLDSSPLSRVEFRVERLEFDPRIDGGELPVHADLEAVSATSPSLGF